MPCPTELLEGLELVIDIYFSNARAPERAAFILCDNLIEIACRTAAIELNRMGATEKKDATAILKSVRTELNELFQPLQSYHLHRNPVQHTGLGLSVTLQFCASAILDTFKTLIRFWPDSEEFLTQRHRVALRILALHSTAANSLQLERFEIKMRQYSWRVNKSIAVKEMAISPAERPYWGLLLRYRKSELNDILDAVERENEPDNSAIAQPSAPIPTAPTGQIAAD